MSHIPGTLVSVNGIGVLLQGASGMGKSDTALMLLRDGHRLIADDAVDVYSTGGRLVGRSPAEKPGLLCLRGPGLFDVTRRFGVAAIAASAPIDWAVELARDRRPATSETDWQSVVIAGIRIPQITLSPDRPVAELIQVVEMAACD